MRKVLGLIVLELGLGFVLLPRKESIVLQGTAKSISLEKPLGILLEEAPEGCVIAEVLEEGSAASNDQIEEGMLVVSVAGKECQGESLEDVMSAISNANSPVEIGIKNDFCLLTVIDGDKKAFVTAQQGDNLRKALLDAGQKVYDFKGSLMNCNGAGQCGTCLVDIQDSAFGPRSDYEANKLKNNKIPSSRLACQTLVPDYLDSATIVLKPKA